MNTQRFIEICEAVGIEPTFEVKAAMHLVHTETKREIFGAIKRIELREVDDGLSCRAEQG